MGQKHTQAKFYQAIEELSLIASHGELHRPPTHLFDFIELARETGRYTDTKAAELKKNLKHLVTRYRRHEHLPQSDEHRHAKNLVLLQYIDFIADGLDTLQSGEDMWVRNNMSVPERKLLAVTFRNALATALMQLRFSQKYYALNRTIRDNLLESIDTSGSLRSLAAWYFLDPRERKDAITKIVKHDFMAAARAADPALESLPVPYVHYRPLKKYQGDYASRKVRISTNLLTDNTMDESLKTAIHECLHYVDDFLVEICPDDYKSDIDLLSNLSKLLLNTPTRTYKQHVYDYTPLEKNQLDQFVCNPIIDLAGKFSAYNTPAKRMITALNRVALNATLFIRCVIG